MRPMTWHCGVCGERGEMADDEMHRAVSAAVARVHACNPRPSRRERAALWLARKSPRALKYVATLIAFSLAGASGHYFWHVSGGWFWVDLATTIAAWWLVYFSWDRVRRERD